MNATAKTARAAFEVRYVNGDTVYVDGGRDAGLAEGTELVLKQSTAKASNDDGNGAVDPGIVARLKVVGVASTSAVCQVVSTTRRPAAGNSQFDSAMASGNDRTVTISRDLTDRLRLNVQGGRKSYVSAFAASSSAWFVNMMVETNLGSRYFLEGAYTTQRGGTQDHNQWTTTFGLRFDNRAAQRRKVHE